MPSIFSGRFLMRSCFSTLLVIPFNHNEQYIRFAQHDLRATARVCSAVTLCIHEHLIDRAAGGRYVVNLFITKYHLCKEIPDEHQSMQPSCGIKIIEGGTRFAKFWVLESKSVNPNFNPTALDHMHACFIPFLPRACSAASSVPRRGRVLSPDLPPGKAAAAPSTPPPARSGWPPATTTKQRGNCGAQFTFVALRRAHRVDMHRAEDGLTTLNVGRASISRVNLPPF